jgi:hypothetical protein
MKEEGRQKAEKSLDVNLMTISSSPAHDKLTAEKAEWVKYKKEAFLRNEGGDGDVVDMEMWESDTITLRQISNPSK